MNAKQVLDRIVKTLSLAKEEVLFTTAKTSDGEILESPTFDLGEPVEVVSEDGKTPAPDGEHEIALRDSEGNEVVIRIVTQDGKITERENVEEAQPEVPEQGEEDMASLAGDDINSPVNPNSTTQAPGEIPQTMEALSYRIEELEKKFADMVKEKETSEAPSEDSEKESMKPTAMAAVDGGEEDSVDETDEEELPKLDGAPVDTDAALKPNNIKFGKKVGDSQSSFLSKLYK